MKVLIVSSSDEDVRWITNILAEEEIVSIKGAHYSKKKETDQAD